MKFDNKNTSVKVPKNACGPYYEYVMPKGMAEAYLDQRKGAEKGVNWRDYLAGVVNTEFGILGTCVSLVVEGV